MRALTTSPHGDGDEPRPGDPGDGELLERAFYRDRNVADVGLDAGAPPVRIGRRLLPRVALVVGLLVVLDVVLRATLGSEGLVRHMTMEPASYLLKVSRFAGSPAPDVLIMGSSRARDGFVPSVLAEALESEWERPVRVYNLGLVNAKAEELYSLASTAMPDPAPERVILAITGSEIVRAHNFQYAARFLWTPALAWRYLQRTSWDDFRIEHFEHYLESAVGRAWFLFRHRDAFRAAIERWVAERMGRDRGDAYDAAEDVEAFVMAPDGFHRIDVGTGMTLAQKLRRDPESVRIPPRELRRPAELSEGGRFQALRDTIAALEARGSRVAIVELPSSPYLQAQSPVQHGHVFRRRMAELADELGLVWVPYPAEANYLSNELYLDINHLTELGAQRYTQGVFVKLRDKGFFAP